MDPIPPAFTAPVPTLPHRTMMQFFSPSASAAFSTAETSPQASGTPHPKSTRTVLVSHVSMAIIAAKGPPITVHSSPHETPDNVLGTLANGTFVAIAQAQADWWEITEPAHGWIPKRATQSAYSHKVEQVELGGQTLTICDRFIGTGNHQYRVLAQAGQTLTVIHLAGPSPRLLSPSGRQQCPINDKRDRRIFELTTSGEYTLELESNFRGYDYGFTVALR